MGFASAAISVPFIPRLSVSDSESLGLIGMPAIFSPVQYLALGILFCGFVSMVLSDSEVSSPRTLLSGIIGSLLGGSLSLAAGLAHRSTASLFHGDGALQFWLEPLVGDILLCVALSLAIVIATHPTRSRMRRAFGAVLAGVAASHILHRAMLFLGMFILIGTTLHQASDFSDRVRRDSSYWKKARFDTDTRAASYPILFGSFLAIGAGLGFAFGLVDLSKKKGWIQIRERTVPVSNGARIGSGVFAEVRVTGDPSVSVVHARIEAVHDEFWIRDAGTSSGVFVDGQRIKLARVVEGSRIKLGSTEVTFRERAVAIAPYRVTTSALESQPNHRLLGPMNDIVDLPIGTLSVGRDASCGLRLEHDSHVSRNHAVLVIEPLRVTIQDLGSRNGTSVNGKPIKGPLELGDKDEVCFGLSCFVYRCS